jgi:hypothetical protein
MKREIMLFLALIFLLVSTAFASHETAKPAVLYMSDEEQIALARSAAPP